MVRIPSLQFANGIRARLITVALIAAVPFVWYQTSDIRASEQANLDSIRAEAIRVAARGASEQAAVFSEARTLLTVIAKVPVVTSGPADRCGQFLSAVSDSRYWAKNLVVANAAGKIVCATDPRALGLDLSDRAYFNDALITRDFTTSGYIYSRLDQAPILTAAYPAFDEDGKLKAMLIAILKLSWFSQSSAEVGRMLGARVLLVDAVGTVLARYPTPASDGQASLADRRVVAATSGKGTGWFEARDDDGVRRLYGVASLGGTDARLAIGISTEAAYAETRVKMEAAYINAAATGVLIILLAWLSGELLVLSPLRDLLSATARLASGELAARASERRGSREFRVLAKSFNAMADRLATLATVDGLTGIANRRRFDQYFDEEWRRALRAGTTVALALVDVDGFKQFNDRYGHQAGDDCLRLIASELSRFARRSEDLVGRYGGEEFAISLPGLSAEEALTHCERVRTAIAELVIPELGVCAGEVTISVGVAVCVPSATVGPETLIAMADAALYDAKRAGRDRVAPFRESSSGGTTAAA